MKKIPSLFKRNFDTHKIYDEVTEGCEWVLKGEGIATRKFDGTACLIKDGELYKRYDCKLGRKKPIGKDGIPCQPLPDPVTGHWPWWIPTNENDKYHLEALKMLELEYTIAGTEGRKPDGTYELCGPKVNSNPEGYDCHILILHGSVKLKNCPTWFDVLPQYMIDERVEGIVWHHPDGRMCKIKLKDFGIKRKGK